MIARRHLLGGLALGSGIVAAPMLFAKSARPKAEPGWRLSEAEWKKRLSPLQYRILREAATERPFTSPLDKEKRAGTFVCAAARCRCIRAGPNMTAAPAGQVSGRR